MECMKYILLLLLPVLFFSCSPQPKPINYGEDKCAYCRMSIVDQRFGGEIVTRKGKVYKFDAAECLVNYLNQRMDDESGVSMILTNTYDQPGNLIDATSCYYLVSKNMPSPMGMFLNPFEGEEQATRFREENQGDIFSWPELRTEFAKYN